MNRRISSTFLLQILFLAFVFQTTNSQTPRTVPTSRYPLHDASTSYFQTPSSQNAAVFIKQIEESSRYPNPFDRQGMNKILELTEPHLKILDYEVSVGDSNAVDLAFSLTPYTDGETAEYFDFILGRLIRANPTQFLNALKKHRAFINRLDALVGNTGNLFTDLVDAQSLERQLRITALQTITDPSLLVVRDECIAALKE